jgi:lysozyme family protein
MVKANFDRALKHVLAHEGGWADHPSDPGGATMKGVTIGTYRRYINAKGTKDDLRNITDAQLAKVYRRQYWNVVGCDDLASGVDYAVFDFAVNSGPSRARSYLLKAIGGSDAQTINRLCDARMAFLRRLKTWPTFGRGWTSRVEGVRKEALRLTLPDRAPIPAPKPQTAPTASPVAATGFWAWIKRIFSGGQR